MTDETNQWIDAIVRLTKLTQEKVLRWSTGGEAPGAIGAIFFSDYKGKSLRLYRTWRRDLIDDGREEVAVLEFIDSSGNSLWSFPRSSAIDDLYEAVKYQVAGVQDFLKDILT